MTYRLRVDTGTQQTPFLVVLAKLFKNHKNRVFHFFHKCCYFPFVDCPYKQMNYYLER